MDVINVNGVEYIPKDSVKIASKPKGKLPYVIIRTYASGVFAGFLEKIWESEGVRIAKLQDARRIWYWEGAASLSQLATDGTSLPDKCKFPCAVDIEVQNVLEVISTTEKAQKSITSVKIWKQ
jgi:hypothetical protein